MDSAIPPSTQVQETIHSTSLPLLQAMDIDPATGGGVVMAAMDQPKQLPLTTTQKSTPVMAMIASTSVLMHAVIAIHSPMQSSIPPSTQAMVMTHSL